MDRQIYIEKKHVVITGSGGRLGSLLVRRFAEAGAVVAAVGRRPPASGDADDSFPGDVTRYACDVTDPEATRALFDTITARASPPDVVVHAVGAWMMTPIGATSIDTWQEVLQTNLTSAFVCFREAIRVMAGRSGRLIAFASGQGADVAQSGQSAYSAAKAGVIRLVESVDAECRDGGIRAFAVAPSFILFDGEEGRGVQASDLADLCLHLTTKSAQSLGGRTIRAYGDRH